jgi:hypothetical protein
MCVPQSDADPKQLLALADAQLSRPKDSGRGRSWGALLGNNA